MICFTDEQFKTILTSQKVKGDLSKDTEQVLTQLMVGETTLDKVPVTFTFDLFVCEDEGVCRMEKKTITQEIDIKSQKNVQLILDVE